MFLLSSAARCAKLDFTGCTHHQQVITCFGIFKQNEQWPTTKVGLKSEKMAFLNKNCFLPAFRVIWAYFFTYSKIFPFFLPDTVESVRLGKISLDSSLAQTQHVDRIINIHIMPCPSFILLHHPFKKDNILIYLLQTCIQQLDALKHVQRNHRIIEAEIRLLHLA